MPASAPLINLEDEGDEEDAAWQRLLEGQLEGLLRGAGGVSGSEGGQSGFTHTGGGVGGSGSRADAGPGGASGPLAGSAPVDDVGLRNLVMQFKHGLPQSRRGRVWVLLLNVRPHKKKTPLTEFLKDARLDEANQV
eukprot:GHVU01211073.1.p2 GENE.GHVU01211073.1~~GHVU01211073.1.p2  ORF type:complete len:136 (+),score=22.87 GHVU01211073.1:1569-1976(+)